MAGLLELNSIKILLHVNYFQSNDSDDGLCEYEKRRLNNIAELESFRHELNLKSFEEEFSLCEVSKPSFHNVPLHNSPISKVIAIKGLVMPLIFL